VRAVARTATRSPLCCSARALSCSRYRRAVSRFAVAASTRAARHLLGQLRPVNRPLRRQHDRLRSAGARPPLSRPRLEARGRHGGADRPEQPLDGRYGRPVVRHASMPVLRVRRAAAEEGERPDRAHHPRPRPSDLPRHGRLRGLGGWQHGRRATAADAALAVKQRDLATAWTSQSAIGIHHAIGDRGRAASSTAADARLIASSD
jgi:hypothetical protein